MARSPGEGGSALRALRTAAGEVEELRRGGLDPAVARGYILRVANAVDRALRRMLRDDEAADLDIRLRALAPDELRADEVLAELRRIDRLPMDLAAGVHEIFETRRRLEQGASPDAETGRRAVRVAERLDAEISRPRGSTAPPPPLPEADSIEETREIVAARRSRRRAPVPAWAAAAAALLLLLAVAAWALSNRGPNHMEEGIALFRTGAYAEAAHHFWRHAEANPRDVTPHLYLARIHRRMDRPDQAAEAIRAAQAIAPEDAAVHRELGFLLLDRGQASTAVERFRHAIELEPASSEGWVGLVRALRDSGRDAEVDGVIARAPAEVRALLGRSDAT